MNWYETENWYAAAKTEELAEQSPAPPKEIAEQTASRPKSRKGFWISMVALVLVCSLLLGLGVPAIRRGRQAPEPTQAPQIQKPSQAERPPEEREEAKPTEEPGNDFSFGFFSDGGEGQNQNDFPFGFFSDDNDGQDSGDNEDGLPDNWTDFFENYYQETDTSNAVVNIEQGELPKSFTLQLEKSAGPDLSLQELYERCAPYIVAIAGYTIGQSGYNWGTGVIISEDGLILTNTHVIDSCDSATVTLFDDREFEASLIGADTFSDLAVLKIDAKGLNPASFGESASIRVGDPVAAIGNPLGDSFRCTLTDGIISAISRDISYKGRSMTLLQTNTALNEGNSGGALFNMQGQVIGITNMKMMSSYSSIEGIGFAIPSSTVRDVVNSIVRFGEARGRPSIGITVGAIPPEAHLKYTTLPEGLYITAVLESSDAWVKGIRPGDILTEVNHIPVTSTNEVTEIKNQFGVGDSLHFTVWRANENQDSGELMEFDVLLMDSVDLYGG